MLLNIGEKIFYQEKVYEVIKEIEDTDGFDNYNYVLIKDVKTNELVNLYESTSNCICLRYLKVYIEIKENEIIKKQEELNKLYLKINCYNEILK